MSDQLQLLNLTTISVSFSDLLQFFQVSSITVLPLVLSYIILLFIILPQVTFSRT